MVREQYLAGDSLSRLARSYGGSIEGIRASLKRTGTPRRSRGGTFKRFDSDAENEIVALYRTGQSQQRIATKLNCGQRLISRTLIKHGIYQKVCVGERHGRWKGGRVVSPSGYVLVHLPANDPLTAMRLANGYVPEHRLVMARHLGRVLLQSESVHHINGKSDDNRIENLQLRQGKHGRGSVHRCRDCGSHDIEAVPIAAPTVD